MFLQVPNSKQSLVYRIWNGSLKRNHNYLSKKLQNDIVHRKISYSLLKNRRLSDIKFRSWTEATLDVTVRWLLRQCGRMETESRRKCIELVCTFIPLLPGTYTSQSFNSNLILFSKVFVLFENISI